MQPASLTGAPRVGKFWPRTGGKSYARKQTVATLLNRYYSQAHRESASFVRGQVVSPKCGEWRKWGKEIAG